MLPLMQWYSILRSSDIRGITASLSVCADATRWWHWGDRSITIHPQPFLMMCRICAIMVLKMKRCGERILRIRAADDFEYVVRKEGFALVRTGCVIIFWEEAEMKTHCRYWHRSAFTTRAWRQYSCAVLRTEPFVLYSSPAAFLFPCIAIPCLLWGGRRGVQNCNPTVTQWGLNATSSDPPALYLSCLVLYHTVICKTKLYPFSLHHYSLCSSV